MAQRTFALKVAVGLSILMLFVIVGGGFIIMGGFSDGPGPGTPAQTTTATTATTTTTPTQTSESFEGVQLPDGVTKNSIDSKKLNTTHREFLDSTSYTLESRTEIKTDTLNGITTETAQVERGGEAFIRRNSPAGTTEIYMNNSIVAKMVDHGSVKYSYSERTEYSTSTERVNMYGILNSGEFSADKTASADNETFVLYKTETKTSAADKHLPGDGVKNYSARVLVSPEGFVKGYSVSYETQMNGDKAVIEISGVYKQIGNTEAYKPNWVSQAEDQQSRIETHKNENFISLVHKGGKTIPAGTEVQVEFNGVDDKTLLNNPFESGDVIYVYQRPDGEMDISTEVPSEDKTQPLPDDADYRFTGYQSGDEIFKTYLLLS